MQIECYQQATGFDALAAEWNPLLQRSAADTIFLTYEWQRTWWDFFATGRELCLLAFRHGGKLVGLAPFYFQALASGKTVLQIIGGVDICDYLDIIALPEWQEQVYQALLTFLIQQAPHWDEIDLHCVPQTSPYQLLESVAQEKQLTIHRRVEDVCPIIPLPDTWDDYLALLNKKQRHELRRKMRRAERETRLEWYIASDPQTLAQEMNSYIDLHHKSSPDKRTFMSDPAMQGFFHQMARFAMEKGWLELSFILLDGHKAATMLCFGYNDRTLVYNSGYDPQQYSHLSPGIVLLGYHIQDSIARKRTAFDFLRGDEVYKYRFGGQDFEIFQITIRRPA
ncbi:MAG: GNAT family N-acetyltransferase [Chloroflexota bacterium]